MFRSPPEETRPCEENRETKLPKYFEITKYFSKKNIDPFQLDPLLYDLKGGYTG